MKALLFSDVHLSDKPPASCSDTYNDDLFGLLDQAAQFAAHCDVVICAGDLFHIKAPSRNSHALVLRTIKALRRFEIPVYVVPGNHDVQHDRLESLHVGQPLGVVLASGAARMLNGWMLDESPPMPVYGVPWLQRWTDEAVSDSLAAYRRQVARQAELGLPWHPLVVAHAPLYPEGKELKFEHYPARKFADAMGMHGSVFYGHVHEPHGDWGFYDERSGVTFCNNGALSRGSLHEYNLARQVGITIWDSETGAFDFVPLHARPAEEVFRLEQAQAKKAVTGRLGEFLAGISSARLATVSAGSVLEHLKAQDGWGPAEHALAEELLEVAAHG